jgi:hypothetical protein
MGHRVRDVLRQGDSGMLLFLVLLGALALTGCANPAMPSPNVPDAIYSLVLAALTASRGFLFRTNEEDKHRAFFVLRRVLALGQGSTAPHTALIKRIEEDHDEVQAFVTAQFSGTKSLANSAPDGPSGAPLTDVFSCKMDEHLDLDNVATLLFPSSDPAEQEKRDRVKKNKIADYHAIRESAARAIIWRAAAIHPWQADVQIDPPPAPKTKRGLWEEDSTVIFPNRLRKVALKEILDRRLRLVERMNFHVNAPGRELIFSESATILPRGPWFDDSRVRMFDYPFFNTASAGALIALKPDGASNDPLWTKGTTTLRRTGTTVDTITYHFADPPRNIPTRISPSPGTVAQATINTTWLRDPDAKHSYSRLFVPEAAGTGPELGPAVDALMVSKKNIWDRPWLYCDHVCLALHLDALRFALIRRLGQTAADDAFRLIGRTTANNRPGFVWLGAALGAAPTNPGKPSEWKAPNTKKLFQGGDDAVWFENAFINPADLQVGDHVIYYNHMVYNAVVGGAFGLENAIVSGLESDPSPKKHGSIVPTSMMVAGHGMHFETLADFGLEMARLTNSAISAFRTFFKTWPLDFFRRVQSFLFIKWNPYPAQINGSDGKAPWFVWLPRSFPDRSDLGYQPPYNNRWASREDMLTSITHTVLDDPAPERPAYQDRPTSVIVDSATGETFQMTDGVLFPLYLPLLLDGTGPVEWSEFFQRRRGHPELQADLFEYQLSNMAQDLNPISHIAGDLPGLFVAGTELLPIQVLRPKVRP